MDQILERRKFISLGIGRFLELSSAGVLGVQVFNNFNERKEYYVTDVSQALNIEQPPLPTFVKTGNGFLASLENLCNAYHAVYYDCDVTTTPDGDGGVDISVDCDWDEPLFAPRHTIVYGWRDQQRTIQQKNEFLVKNSLLDKTKLDDIKVVEQEESRLLQGFLATLMYGGQIALLLGYEEIGALDDHGWVRRNNEEREARITRRGLFKLGASVLGIGAARSVGNYNKDRSVGARYKLESEVESAVKNYNAPNEFAFVRYYGQSPFDIIRQVQNYVDVSKKAAGRILLAPRVKNAFTQVVQAGENYISDLREIFKKGVPNDVGEMTRMGYLTQTLKSLSTKESIRSKLGLFAEGAVVACTIAAILVPFEYFNNKLSSANSQ